MGTHHAYRKGGSRNLNLIRLILNIFLINLFYYLVLVTRKWSVGYINIYNKKVKNKRYVFILVKFTSNKFVVNHKQMVKKYIQ